MPWEKIKLNDGNMIPGIGFGCGESLKGREEIDQLKQALAAGFTHIDTAKLYQNEYEVGQAIKESRLGRKNVFITTKFSHLSDSDTGIQTSIKNSLRNLDVDYIDLYLVHGPTASSDIPALWRQFEEFQRKGWVKSIGVSNFHPDQLRALLASAKVKPAVLQVLYHPYVISTQAEVLDICKANGIRLEAYSPLTPLYKLTSGPVNKPLAEISARRGVGPEQILLAWSRAKGAVVLTQTTKKERMKSYIAAGDLELTESEIAAIDAAGKKGNVDLPPDFY